VAKSKLKQANSALLISFIGGTIVVLLFAVGVALLVHLNSSAPLSPYRDVALLFGAALAATGAVTAALVAFGSAQKVEEQKDFRERARRIDFERAGAEYSLLSLHVVATTLDRIYRRARDDAERLSSAAARKDLKAFIECAVKSEAVPAAIRVLDEMAVNFLKDRELKSIRNIQVGLDLLSRRVSAIKEQFNNVQLATAVKQDCGDTAFWSVCEYQAQSLQTRAKDLFDRIVPYINERAAGVMPDEAKLNLLLGGYASEVAPKILSLDEVKIFLRGVADDMLRQHVAPDDLRKFLRATADQVRDEDAVPV
jgi:hypothetical protein